MYLFVCRIFFFYSNTFSNKIKIYTSIRLFISFLLVVLRYDVFVFVNNQQDIHP